MMKFLKWTFYLLAGLALLLFLAFKILQTQTKKNSPEETVTYTAAGNEMEVFYNRPYKKGRRIFGELVPFGEVWRTGANEATTFATDRKIFFGDKTVPAGTYTLWTIPGEEEWAVIINKKQYAWGVSVGGKASREPAADIAQVHVPVEETDREIEQFTIAFEGEGAGPKLVLSWDRTEVRVPIRW